MRRGLRAFTWLVGEAESAVDWLRYRRREPGPFRIVPYRGHGTTDTLYVRGRVLEGKPIPPASEHDSAWRNLAHTLRRLESDEVPAARVRACAGDATVEAVGHAGQIVRPHIDVDLGSVSPAALEEAIAKLTAHGEALGFADRAWWMP